MEVPSSLMGEEYAMTLLFDIIPSELERILGDGAYALALKIASRAVANVLELNGSEYTDLARIFKELLGDMITDIAFEGNEMVIMTNINASSEAQRGALAGIFVGILKALGYNAIAPKRPIRLPRSYAKVVVQGSKVLITLPDRSH